eukprot:1482-Heterococcus_DN1.PRE.1
MAYSVSRKCGILRRSCGYMQCIGSHHALNVAEALADTPRLLYYTYGHHSAAELCNKLWHAQRLTPMISTVRQVLCTRSRHYTSLASTLSVRTAERFNGNRSAQQCYAATEVIQASAVKWFIVESLHARCRRLLVYGKDSIVVTATAVLA